MKPALLILLTALNCEAAMTNILQHPNTVAGVAVEHGVIATACFDGFVRVLEPTGGLIYAEHRASQLYGVAIRDGLVATDTDSYNGRDPVAIAPDGSIIRSPDFSASVRMNGISITGTWAVGQDLICRNRITRTEFLATPTINPIEWPMCIEEAFDGTLVVGGLDGWVRRFTPDGQQIGAAFIESNGVTALDVAADGRVVCVDFSGSVYLLNSSFSVISRANLGSIGYSVKFSEGSAIIGTHAGALLRWDLQPDATPTTTTTTKTKGRHK